MESQVENAIEIAFSPSAEPGLKQQAYAFLQQLRSDPAGWSVCLELFVRTPPASEVVRHVALEIVNTAIQTKKLDQQGLDYARDRLRDYAQQQYNPSAASQDPIAIQNKLTQTLTFLFLASYGTNWQSFFADFRIIAGDTGNLGTANPPGTILYLRLLRSIHDEIADVLIIRSAAEHQRSTATKDKIRRDDAAEVAKSWLDILSKWRQLDPIMVELCLKCVSRWVSWTDISLVVNADMLQCLWDLAAQEASSSDSPEGKVRLAAVETFTEVVAKKMPGPDKIQLLQFLNLADVISRLVNSQGLSEYRSTSNYDTDLGEIVAKLLNTVLFDVIKVLEMDDIEQGVQVKSEELLQMFSPYLLRFFADEYDEICSTVIPSMTDLLALLRRKVKTGVALQPHHIQMLQPILDSIISKMKYDETADWGAEDERTDEAEFQDLRKRLHVLQQSIAAVDETLYMETVSRLVANTFSRVDSGDNSITWREIDLALYEIFLFGELAVKSNGLYQKGTPSNQAGQHLIVMMSKLIDSNLAAHPHPSIQLQYMEICVRYCSFFENNSQCIGRALESFVRFIHSEHPKVRTRSWYLFFRFVKHLRSHLGQDAQTVMQSFGDLLEIKAEVSKNDDNDDSSADLDDQSADAVFDSQLYLFEAIGCLASTPSIPIETQTFYARSVLEPLVADLNNNISLAGSGQERAVLQVHHTIMAIGTLAKGFCDWLPGVNSAGPPPASELSSEFHPSSEAILSALNTLKASELVRSSARFSFSRMLGVLGSRSLEQLPRWIDGLLPDTSTNDELAVFLRLLDQVVFAYKTSISSILDTLLGPLLQRVFAGLSSPVTGTDDEMELSSLKAQYLNFLLVILNNELASVLVSTTNQPSFESVLSSLEHFTRDTSDYVAARLAFGVLIRMVSVWGGPDVIPTSTGGVAPTNGTTAAQQPAPVLPGFDSFAITRFSPLTWATVTNSAFNPKDAQARNVCGEAAALQWTILRKCGAAYEAYLRDSELRSAGLDDAGVADYLARMRSEQREWKRFWTGMVTRLRGG